MTNEQLVALIQAGEDVADNMLLLYNQIKPFIHTVALRYRSDAELEDLEQEGYLALYPAVDGYDPAAGCKFLTYAESGCGSECSVICKRAGAASDFPPIAWKRCSAITVFVKITRNRMERSRLTALCRAICVFQWSR